MKRRIVRPRLLHRPKGWSISGPRLDPEPKGKVRIGEQEGERGESNPRMAEPQSAALTAWRRPPRLQNHTTADQPAVPECKPRGGCPGWLDDLPGDLHAVKVTQSLQDHRHGPASRPESPKPSATHACRLSVQLLPGVSPLGPETLARGHPPGGLRGAVFFPSSRSWSSWAPWP